MRDNLPNFHIEFRGLSEFLLQSILLSYSVSSSAQLVFSTMCAVILELNSIFLDALRAAFANKPRGNSAGLGNGLYRILVGFAKWGSKALRERQC